VLVCVRLLTRSLPAAATPPVRPDSQPAAEVGAHATSRPASTWISVRCRFRTIEVATTGDSDLDNDEFIDGSRSLLKDAGSHPGSYIDFCAEVTAYFFG
jgi:hypothetical protein